MSSTKRRSWRVTRGTDPDLDPFIVAMWIFIILCGAATIVMDVLR